MSTRVAINGFGRIGRNVLRAAYLRKADVEIVAINDLTDPKTLAHLLRYDSVLGRFDHQVEVTDGGIAIDGREIRVLAERDADGVFVAPLTWKSRRLGALVATTPARRAFTTEERILLRSVANQAATAVESSRGVMRGIVAQEIHHRVKNNLQTAASLQRLRASGADPQRAPGGGGPGLPTLCPKTFD